MATEKSTEQDTVNPNESRPEQRELAFQAHLAHYDALRQEINSLNQIQNQLVNYSIAIIAGSITLSALGSPPLITQQPLIILVISILMSAISWAFMEAELRIHDRGSYLEDVLRKKVQKIIGNEEKFEYTVLNWESSDTNITRLALRGITATGKFAIAYIPSVASIFAFYFIRPPSIAPWTNLETILFWVAIVVAAILPIGLLLNVNFVMRYYGSLRSSEKKSVKKSQG